jgi:hypothetical protein
MGFKVDFGHERAGGVDGEQPPIPGLIPNLGGNAVGAIEQGGPFGNLVERLDKNSSPPFEAIDHVLVVHNLVIHVNGWSKEVECPLQALNCHIDTGTESAGVCKDDLHDASRSSFGRFKRTYPRRWAKQGEDMSDEVPRASSSATLSSATTRQ